MIVRVRVRVCARVVSEVYGCNNISLSRVPCVWTHSQHQCGTYVIPAAKLCEPQFLAVQIIKLFQVRQRFVRRAGVAVSGDVINLAPFLSVPVMCLSLIVMSKGNRINKLICCVHSYGFLRNGQR